MIFLSQSINILSGGFLHIFEAYKIKYKHPLVSLIHGFEFKTIFSTVGY